ncbi:FtsH protease activity modulator HflK [Rhodospirillum sp. A1_3_36]|uniref:FtsH protease activity modulator HflK n=1 Tax=Rhodospirillum sp. A1_3_36 TaxID=3391666 RepID=UPI0039A43515
MAWNQQGGGGPWGSGGGGGGPWGSGGGGRGNNGRGNQPPDLEEVLRKGQERFKSMIPGGSGGGLGSKGIAILVLLALAIWLLSGFYRVGTDEQGVVMRFGEYTTTTPPGLHYHLPYPVETVLLPKVTRENRVEIGLRGSTGRPGEVARDVLEESLMLTGDENIIDIDFSLVWVIKDAGEYLFNLRDPRSAVTRAAESVMREVIGQTPIQVALTEGRQAIEERAKSMLQALLDEYKSGIQIRRLQLLKVDPPAEVVDAFNDVQRAETDKVRLRNEAEAYRNSVIPAARGNAEQLVQQAEAYKEEIVNRAQGDASRFDQIYKAYKVDKDVTTKRIYLETMEDVLASVNKIIIDKDGQGVVPYLPLPELNANRSDPGRSTSGASTAQGSK